MIIIGGVCWERGGGSEEGAGITFHAPTPSFHILNFYFSSW